MDLIDVRISLYDREKGFLDGKMDFGTGDLLLYTADHGSGQDDVADRAEPDNEDLFQCRFFTKVRLQL
jgi:hypothetical protein